MEDIDIVNLIYNRDESGLSATKDKYNSLLTTISYEILKNKEDANECVNDTYLKTWNSIPPAKPTYFKAFICKIVRQTSLDKYRFLHRKTRDIYNNTSLEDISYEISSKENTESIFNEKVLNESINNFLNSLDIESKTLFVRKYFFLESSSSLATRFEINENLINVKLYRLRKKLLAYLKKEGYSVEKI